MAKKSPPKKKCSCCGKDFPLQRGFYSSKSPLYAADGKINICKECFVKSALNLETNEIDEAKLKNILRKTDYPFYRDILQSSVNEYARANKCDSADLIAHHGDKVVAIYLKNINTLKQVSEKTFEDSERDGFLCKTSKVFKNTNDSIKMFEGDKEKKYYSTADDFVVTDEMTNLFGDGYTSVEYKKMYEKYEKLKINYTLQTNIHQEALATYVRFKVKEEDATARGDVDEAKKWYDAAQNAAEKAKLTPKQLTKADLDSGVNSISELTKALEQAVDVIKILPRFKYRPNDAVDFNIFCYVDYERKLNDKPPVSYEEIYSFYDKKKEEYIKQNGDPYGIFANDPTKKNRETVKTFITLPDDYDEWAGDNNDNE